MSKKKPSLESFFTMTSTAHARDEDTFDTFEPLLGFGGDGVVQIWEWQQAEKHKKEAFVGKSKIFAEVIESAKKLTGTKANVLIIGASGTGKELLAHYIHQLENNPQRPFIAINCGAIPDNLLESELFGHEKGSFTNAFEKKIGKFELANGGDIFLDEISTLKPELQVKLLRVLQDQRIYRLGGKEPIQLNFRVIAASNQNLQHLTDEKQFRLDLYHRLAVIPMKIPSLQERKEDIPLLVNYFMNKYHRSGCNKQVTSDALDLLQKQTWAGNIRELENIIQRLLVMFPRKIIDTAEILKALNCTEMTCQFYTAQSESVTASTLKEAVFASEKEFIKSTLNKMKWNISRTANELQISRNTLYSKIKSYQITKP